MIHYWMKWKIFWNQYKTWHGNKAWRKIMMTRVIQVIFICNQLHKRTLFINVFRSNDKSLYFLDLFVQYSANQYDTKTLYNWPLIIYGITMCRAWHFPFNEIFPPKDLVFFFFHFHLRQVMEGTNKDKKEEERPSGSSSKESKSLAKFYVSNRRYILYMNLYEAEDLISMGRLLETLEIADGRCSPEDMVGTFLLFCRIIY